MSSFVAIQRATTLLRHWFPFANRKGQRSYDASGSEVTQVASSERCTAEQHQANEQAVFEQQNSPAIAHDHEMYEEEEEDYFEEESTVVLTPLDRIVKSSASQFAEAYTSSSPALLPPQRPEDEGRMTVVLDMDETLLHALVEPISSADQGVPEGIMQHDFECGFKYGDDYFSAKVWKRPGLQRFLKELHEICEPIIFTAGSRDYAEPVIDTFDTEEIVRERLYREAVCGYPAGGPNSYVKDLSQLGRRLSRTIIIDNTPRVFALHPSNGIAIKDFHGDDPNCTALDQLLEVIRDMVNRHDEDVRDIISEMPIFHPDVNDFGRVPF